ncbi:hypothetical protein HKX15_17925 [Sulfitobacter sp. KE37]|uniref:hypothetical protein n=1 Tax=unclassified Sulfitobacter TaxID=196795 RepID=UPI0023E0A468|nr:MULTISPECIES: hypothetical protein [unclassified Sulfitobacter]MDF3352067.1 hypothetical protein [Sulfitobacter sp. KE12]MDF3355694.1 hypothetical protein [Sulfitobacter sp. KE27]MDF3370375.1 hypothetical protein [Sulfitobacter sp. Ks43]MDF3374026.1 hypothetical protein [Sulfitobacter sp. KS8]MDF3377660.1 hypothetical protein [Sulfitobacter sp. KE37]
MRLYIAAFHAAGHKLRYVVPAIALITAQAVSADPNLAAYYTTIGREDFYNSKGAPLKSVGAVIQQDRANFHRFGLRHAGDETDPYFSNPALRAMIPDLVRAGGVDRYLQKLLGSGWQGYNETWLIQVCGTPGRVTHLRIDPADGDGYSDC